MRNWKEHFGLIEVRTKAGDHVWGNVNRYLFLTAEVAMPLEPYASLPPWEQATARAAAVALTIDSAVVVGSAAARLMGIQVLGWAQPTVDTMLVDGKHPKAKRLWPRGVTFRYGHLPADCVYEEHGMRVSRISRTLRDICCFDGVAAGVVALDSARHNWPDIPIGQVRDAMLAGPRFKGAAAVREAVALSIPNSGSVSETRARLLLRGLAGIVTIEVQAKFIDEETGETYYVDFLINGWLILEVDGDVKYDGVTYGRTDDVIRKERRREKALQNMGKVVVRVTDPLDAPAVVAAALDRFAHAVPVAA
ncbi:hypothetical protein ACFWGD_06030 [Corynebacterium sp. NPDC060344]|uniref:hypothetical protein n=1 Tax=Corynebacterium sp. NPDC060344 TaxID=3347101 RepID=UPI00365A91FE